MRNKILRLINFKGSKVFTTCDVDMHKNMLYHYIKICIIQSIIDNLIRDYVHKQSFFFILLDVIMINARSKAIPGRGLTINVSFAILYE